MDQQDLIDIAKTMGVLFLALGSLVALLIGGFWLAAGPQSRAYNEATGENLTQKEYFWLEPEIQYIKHCSVEGEE